MSEPPGGRPRLSAVASRTLTTTWLVTALAAAAGCVLTVFVRGNIARGDLIGNLAESLAGVYYATLGVLIVRRAANRIGWLMLGLGALIALESLANGYGVAGIRRPGTLPAATLVGLFAEWVFVPLFITLIGTFLLFPDGQLPSSRWRPAAWVVAVVAVLEMTGFAIVPRLVRIPAPGGSVLFPNPLGVASLGPVWSGVLLGTLTALALASLPLLAIAVVALVTRFRRGGPDVRQQVKWLAFALAVMLVAQLLGPLRDTATGGPDNGPLVIASDAVSAAVPLAVVPAVVTLAILKYRLYQIDVIINKAVKYGLLLAALTAVYAVIVVGIGTLAGYVGGPLLTVAAAVAIAVLFQPARDRAQRLANRFVYGRRATPYQVLADFAQDMAGQPDATATLDRMAALLAGATGATGLTVWIRVGDQLRPQATWPAGSAATEPVPLADGALPDFEATRAVAVRHGNELLGALTVVKPPDEPVSAAEESLLAHLASQTGLVLRNLRLTAELRATIDDLTASRQRLVRAQDEERHRIERNLHDGAQQQLVALSILLRLLEDSAEDPGEVKHLAVQLKDGLRAALEDLRALARGIYPPLLAEQGLRAALRAHADRVPVPVLVEADGIGRYRRDTEATAYFCILEALQNVAKYARASRASIELACPDGHLEFTVADDGVGFDAATTTTGTGLQGMADRVAAVGGSLRVRSAPGTGTTIHGRLPV
ncbi:MAG: histidine kinase [Trebonia sp.]|uniref:sensor histidine kinase n=1 Tax=Trebonia sp. TaxID=2767075 RepID=UPI003BB00F47